MEFLRYVGDAVRKAANECFKQTFENYPTSRWRISRWTLIFVRPRPVAAPVSAGRVPGSPPAARWPPAPAFREKAGRVSCFRKGRRRVGPVGRIRSRPIRACHWNGCRNAAPTPLGRRGTAGGRRGAVPGNGAMDAFAAPRRRTRQGPLTPHSFGESGVDGGSVQRPRGRGDRYARLADSGKRRQGTAHAGIGRSPRHRCLRTAAS